MSIQERRPVNYGSVEQPHLEKPSRKCCRIKYRVRYFYSKGAFLMLLWTTLISMTTTYYCESFIHIISSRQNIGNRNEILVLLPLFICIPVIGWLADAKFGNYKLFKAGIILLFLAVISSQMISLTSYFAFPASYIHSTQSIIGGSLGICGIGTCTIIALQLGLDQMPDASADNITSFIAWFICLIFVRVWIPYALFDAVGICIEFDTSTIITYLRAPLIMTIVCCTVFILTPRCLVVEPKSPKALKTIYQVLKFAAKHKAPLYRSALTYWEEDIPSRLDLGKSKYGGPFTTEQVEDVKTFFKILIMFIPTSIVCLAIFTETYSNLEAVPLKDKCFSKLLITFSSDLAWGIVVSTIVYELGIYPLMRNKIPTTLKRFAIGSFLLFLIKVLFLIQSILNFTTSGKSALINHEVWADIALNFFQHSVIMFLINGLLEFVCAQSPYNMRGLLTGCTVFMIITSFVLSSLIYYLAINSSLFVTDYKDICHRAVSTALSLVGFILHCVLAHWYKRRVRDEDYPAHRVVEEVYDRYLSHVH